MVYENDIIIVGDDELEKQTLKEWLAVQFEKKDLEKLKYFIWIEVGYSKQYVFISQSKYSLGLLIATGKLGYKTIGASIEQNHRTGSNKESPKVKAPYQSCGKIHLSILHSARHSL